MKATVVTMTPQLAESYLLRNNNNRKICEKKLNSYIDQMKQGKWKENGESIIIDTTGEIKDGQHRLIALIKANISYRVPVITDVEPDVMDTIDTGKNRSSADVLFLEGFKRSFLLASTIKAILINKVNNSSKSENFISNYDILEYAKEHKEYLYEIIRVGSNIDSLQVPRLLSPTMIVFYLHKFGNNQNTVDFLHNIIGLNRQPKSSMDYVYKQLNKAKSGDIRLSIEEKQKLIERSYYYYIKGNPNVSFIKIK
jgi:hypothetical protein